MVKKINLAMIQLENYYQDQTLGYKKAASLITQSAAQGAQLAVLPELSGCGYIPNQTIWDFAEPADGKTVRWACNLSKKLGIYIGAGFIETDGEDFYNSYLLSNPQGNICEIIRKEDAESYCFKRSPGKLFIDTDIGRIGIGICADNHNAERLFKMKTANIDFMLMPHANPSPYKLGPQISKKDLKQFQEIPYQVAVSYSNYLRVPTVYVNSVGSFPKFIGGLGVKNFNNYFRLMGGSLITNATGGMIIKMDSKEGFTTSTITIGKIDKTPILPTIYHRKWIHPGNAIYRYLILPATINKGMRNYKIEHLKFLEKNRKGL